MSYSVRPFFTDQSARWFFLRRRRGRRGKLLGTKSLRTRFSSPFFFLQTHPQQNMIASGSIDSDLTVKVWADRGSS